MSQGERRPNPWLALAAASLAILLIAVNTTSINSAINDVADDLSLSTTTLTWVVNAYVVASAAFVALAGRLGDVIGIQRVFYLGYAAFIVGSVGAAVAPGAEVLIGARFFQGLAAAILMTASTAAIGAATPTERKGLAMGIWGAVGGAGLALGPLWGAVLTDVISWRAIFWADLLFIAAGAVLAVIGLRNLPRPAAARFDVGAGIVLALGIFLVVAAAQGAQGWGFGSPLFLTVLGAGVAALIVFAAIERRRDPDARLIDMRLFRYPAFTGACSVTFAGVAGIFGMLFFFNLYAQSDVVLGYSPIVAAAALLPFGVALFVMSLVVGPIADRVGYRLPLTAGMALAAIGFFLLADLSTGEGGIELWVPLGIAGIGVGATWATAGAVGLAAVPRRFLGEAAGIFNTVRYVGGALALAVGSALYLSTAVRTFNAELAASDRPVADVDQLDNALTGTNDGLEDALRQLEPTEESVVARAAEIAISDGFRSTMVLLAVFAVVGTVVAALTFVSKRDETDTPA